MERLHDETIQNFVAQSGLSLVLFGAPSGRPTMAQAEVAADLWADYADEIHFGHIDTLACEAARKAFNIRLLPSTLVFRDGKLISRHDGFHARQRIEKALGLLLAKDVSAAA